MGFYDNNSIKYADYLLSNIFIMNHSFKFNVDDKTFLIELTESSEIQFYVEIPYYESPHYKDEIKWAKWGEDMDFIYAPRYSHTASGVGVNIFRFIRELKKQVKRLISKNQLDFFYFVTSSPKKALLYKKIYRDVQNEFSEWDVQFIDDTYFYFYRKTNGE